MEKLKQLMDKLAKSQEKMGKVLEQAGPDLDFKKVTEVSGSDIEKAAAFRAINDECSEHQKALDAHRADLKAKEDYEKRNLIAKVHQPGKTEEKNAEQKGESNIADAMLKMAGIDPESDKQADRKLKEFFWNKEIEIPSGISIKTLMDTTAWVPETLRTGRVIDKAMRPIELIDLIPAGQTGQSAVVYMEETTLTENAAEAAEGTGAYGENAYALTERSSTVRKIAAFLPVTDEQLEDVPQVRGYLNNRLPMSLRRRLDGQILNGNGTPPNLTGILNTSSIQTHLRSSVSGDKPVDALYRAMRKVRVTGRAVPNGIIIHPEDFENIRLMKTNDGAYVWGHPSDAGPERIWGLPIAQSDHITALTAVVGDFMYSELAERRGIVVKISDSHDTYFIYGKQAIRADMRVAFIVYRAAAFCQVTL